MASCSISERSMAAYLRRLELGYDSDNPFHNRSVFQVLADYLFRLV